MSYVYTKLIPIVVLQAAYLRVCRMEAPLWHVEGIASCTHNAPEQVRFPFHTPKRCQGTVHDVVMQYIVELRWCPSGARRRPPISLVRKSQVILQVLPYPLCQFCGQPPHNWMCRSVGVLQPLWTCNPLGKCDEGSWILHQFNSAGLQKIDVKACTASRIS